MFRNVIKSNNNKYGKICKDRLSPINHIKVTNSFKNY